MLDVEAVVAGPHVATLDPLTELRQHSLLHCPYVGMKHTNVSVGEEHRKETTRRCRTAIMRPSYSHQKPGHFLSRVGIELSLVGNLIATRFGFLYLKNGRIHYHVMNQPLIWYEQIEYQGCSIQMWWWVGVGGREKLYLQGLTPGPASPGLTP